MRKLRVISLHLKKTPFSLLVAGVDDKKEETYGRSDMLLLAHHTS